MESPSCRFRGSPGPHAPGAPPHPPPLRHPAPGCHPRHRRPSPHRTGRRYPSPPRTQTRTQTRHQHQHQHHGRPSFPCGQPRDRVRPRHRPLRRRSARPHSRTRSRPLVGPCRRPPRPPDPGFPLLRRKRHSEPPVPVRPDRPHPPAPWPSDAPCPLQGSCVSPMPRHSAPAWTVCRTRDPLPTGLRAALNASLLRGLPTGVSSAHTRQDQRAAWRTGYPRSTRLRGWPRGCSEPVTDVRFPRGDPPRDRPFRQPPEPSGRRPGSTRTRGGVSVQSPRHPAGLHRAAPRAAVRRRTATLSGRPRP